MIAQSCAADQAHLRSHSGPGSREVFHGSPTQLEIHRLPLHITEALCECGAKGTTELDATEQLVHDRVD